jgi:MoxR-like ATPase
MSEIPQQPSTSPDVPAAPAAPATAPAAPAANPAGQQRQRATQMLQALRLELHKAVVGQRQVVDDVLTALIAGGHVLVEGVPGLGKTLLVRALARCFGGEFARIQFTPDLMPSDVTGHAVYDLQSEQFKLRKGPAFTNLLLADEINRAPAKTQAALLEVMQERQITLEGRAMPVPQPFLVLATQNPIEQEGTYPLPEAELDRFMLKLRMDYPQADEELSLVRQVTRSPKAQGRAGPAENCQRAADRRPGARLRRAPGPRHSQLAGPGHGRRSARLDRPGAWRSRPRTVARR